MGLFALVAVALLAQAAGQEPGERGPQRWASERSRETFLHLQQLASTECTRSRLPDECWAADMAASYSQINLMMCRERFRGPVPGTATLGPDYWTT